MKLLDSQKPVKLKLVFNSLSQSLVEINMVILVPIVKELKQFLLKQLKINLMELLVLLLFSQLNMLAMESLLPRLLFKNQETFQSWLLFLMFQFLILIMLLLLLHHLLLLVLLLLVLVLKVVKLGRVVDLSFK